MKSSEIYGSLYDWVRDIVPSDVSIIKAYGNGPMPKGHFMMIDPIPSANKVGQAEQADPEGTPNGLPFMEQYRGTIDIWEVDGTDCLYSLIQALRNQAEPSRPKGLVIYNMSGPISTPNLIDGATNWQVESRLTLSISWVGFDDRKPTYVKEIVADGEIGDLVNDPVEVSVDVKINS